MKFKKIILSLIPLMSTSLLIGCANNNNNNSQSQIIDEGEEWYRDPTIPLEVGDVAKEWKTSKSCEGLPMGIFEDSNLVAGDVQYERGNGVDDSSCLLVNIQTNSKLSGYLSSKAVEKPFFKDSDVTNGDIVSLYVYVTSDSNIDSLQLELTEVNSENSFKSNELQMDGDNYNRWIRLVSVFDSIGILNEIKLNVKTATEDAAYFYIDDITVTFGEETEVAKSNYVYNYESLCGTYQDYFKVGTCLSSRMNQNQIYRKITKDNFNSVTAENEGKPEQILDQAGCKELAKTDITQVAITTKPFENIYDFCEANHIQVRHHTFVWYSQTPAWFFNDNYDQNGNRVSKEIMLERMRNFIRVTLNTLNERWPGLIYAIDVSNEAVDNHTTRRNNNNWYSVVGEDFVYHAFEYAALYKDPEQKLYYNDYSFDYDIDNCKYALNTLLKQAIADGFIDGVGIQGHLDSNANLDVVINDAKLIYEQGLECQITELDITTNGSDASNLNKQKDAYKNLVKKVINANQNSETNITAIVLWGITDNYSWKSGQHPLLFDSDFNKKPAYYGFLEAINEL